LMLIQKIGRIVRKQIVRTRTNKNARNKWGAASRGEADISCTNYTPPHHFATALSTHPSETGSSMLSALVAICGANSFFKFPSAHAAIDDFLRQEFNDWYKRLSTSFMRKLSLHDGATSDIPTIRNLAHIQMNRTACLRRISIHRIS